MPPPPLPPSERIEGEDSPVPGPRRHIGKLFWVGVAIAPIAALLLVLGSGVGPLRAAAALAILSVVIIGLSVVLRDDAAMVKDDVEDQLRTEVDGLRAEIDSLRRGVEVSVHRELERVHRELEATRRESVIRAESTRLNNNRLTGGALPAAEEEYPGERQRRGSAPATGRGRSERRAITARTEAAAAAAASVPSAESGYDWFGGTDEEPGQDPASAGRSEQIRYDAGTYGAGAATPGTTYGTARPAETADAGSDDRGRRRRSGNVYGAESATEYNSGATEYNSGGTEYNSGATRREATTYGSAAAAAPEQPAEEAGRSRHGRRRAEENSGSFEAPNYGPTGYEVIDYDAAPPVYSGSDGQYADSRYPDARYAEPQYSDTQYPDAQGPDTQYRGGRATPEQQPAGEPGTLDYSEFWARSASPAANQPTDRAAADQDAGSEWSSWRGYDREDPQVITGAITGPIYDAPYTVGGQTLSEPGFGAEPQFGTGNGFAASSSFGSSGGFGAPEPRWDDEPAAPGWAPAGSARTPEPASDFELPNLDHLPAAETPDAAGGTNAGGRHASGGDDGRYQSW